jgi:hypothetical protein
MDTGWGHARHFSFKPTSEEFVAGNLSKFFDDLGWQTANSGFQNRTPNRVSSSCRPEFVTFRARLPVSRATHFLLSATFNNAAPSAPPK